MQHTISVVVENRFGALARIAGLFSGRGFNIESLTVSPTCDHSLSKMTIVTSGNDAIVEQIDKQLNKLVDVVQVTDLQESDYVTRELAMLKVNTSGETRSEIMQIADIFKASIVHVCNEEAVVIELTGASDKIDAFINLMKKFGIVELIRTGKVALAKAAEPTEDLGDFGSQSSRYSDSNESEE